MASAPRRLPEPFCVLAVVALGAAPATCARVNTDGSWEMMAASRAVNLSRASAVAASERVGEDICDIPSFPLLPSIEEAKDACGLPLYGTLLVNCVSGDDLSNRVGVLTSSPYCRVRLVDLQKTEEAKHGFVGTMLKYVTVSGPMAGKPVSRDLSPIWDDLFKFHLNCPRRPPNFESLALEVTVKDDGFLYDLGMGQVFLPLHEIMSGKHSGRRSHELGRNLADPSDSRQEKGKINGSVILDLTWCPGGSSGERETCIKKQEVDAPEDEELGRVESFTCDMACHKQLVNRLVALLAPALVLEKEAWKEKKFNARKWDEAVEAMMTFRDDLLYNVAVGCTGAKGLSEPIKWLSEQGGWVKKSLLTTDGYQPRQPTEYGTVLSQMIWQMTLGVRMFGTCLSKSFWAGRPVVNSSSDILTVKCRRHFELN